MAYTLKLGTFAKLENSTAQPTTTGWAEYNVTLKGGADLFNPTVTLAEDSQNLIGKNYATMMGKYYFVTGVTAIRNDLCEVDLKLDSLATFKSTIGAASLYVLRSASSSNGNIVDKMYPTTTISYSHAEDASFYPGSYSLGQYIVNVVGTNTAGTSTLWKLTPSAFRDLIGNLYTNIDGFQISDIYDAIIKLIDGSPDKLVSSAMWMPPYNFTTSASEEVVIGTWPSGVTASLISDPIFSLTPIELTLPKHPQAATRGSFLNLAPYTTYTLTIPMFGSINIDTTAVKNASKIYVAIKVDAVSGQGACQVYSGDSPSPLLADLSAQIGVPVPLQGQNAGASVAGGVASTLAQGITAVVSGGLAPALGAGLAAIDTAVGALTGASFSTGSGGGALATQYNIALDATFMHIADEDNTLRGRPLCEVKTISTLSGYILVAEGDVAIPAPLPIQQEVKAFLEGGFFYE